MSQRETPFKRCNGVDTNGTDVEDLAVAPMRPKICPRPGTFGAEVSAFDIRRVSPSDCERLRGALDEHLLLIFKHQSLSFNDQVALTGIFGRVDHRIRPGEKPFRHPDDPRIHVVSNDRRTASQSTATVFWHTDQSFRKCPSPVIVLKAVVMPRRGGNTMFADMRTAYETLDPSDKKLIGRLKARHRFGALMGIAAGSRTSRRPDAVHPLARKHPITGRRSLYLNQFCIEGIEGWPRSASSELLQRLYAHALAAKFIYVHQWQLGDVLVWDNGSLMHRVAGMPEALRVLHRTHTRGDIARRQFNDGVASNASA
jgi:taurine dioxygenase